MPLDDPLAFGVALANRPQGKDAKEEAPGFVASSSVDTVRTILVWRLGLRPTPCSPTARAPWARWLTVWLTPHKKGPPEPEGTRGRKSLWYIAEAEGLEPPRVY
jgi:hypothetical protein